MDIKNLIPGRKRAAELQAMRTELSGVKDLVKLQALVIDDIATATTAGKQAYVGNNYQTYMAVIKELARKYEGKAKWGVLQTGNIIDVRSAFIIGQGLSIGPIDPKDKAFKGSKEEEFIKKFLDFNDLDREMCQELAKEAEIEGCILLDLVWDEKGQMVCPNYISRADTGYMIETASLDKFDYIEAKWQPSGSSTPTVLSKEKFVYSRFGGRIHKPNEPYPKVGKALNEIDSISRALRDWREINHLFTAPVPVIEAKDPESAKAIDVALGGLNWKIRRQIIIAGGKLVFAQPNLEGGSDALEKEVVVLAKMISGTTGVPVHFLGLPDLMSNRATADNLMELVSASTSKERQIWIGTYEEMISKAMETYNNESKLTKLNPKRFKVSIPFVTAEAWQRIKDIWLPAYLANAITLQTFLAQIPGIIAEEEAAAVEAKEADDFEKFLPRIDNLNPAGNQNPGDRMSGA